MGIINGSFAAQGNSGAVGVEANQVELIVGGTFVGTVQLQVCIPGAAGAELWVSVGQLTAPGAVTFLSGQCRRYRASCTAYTSGTAYYSIGGACVEDYIA